MDSLRWALVADHGPGTHSVGGSARWSVGLLVNGELRHVYGGNHPDIETAAAALGVIADLVDMGELPGKGDF